jgi:hypothetical protein
MQTLEIARRPRREVRPDSSAVVFRSFSCHWAPEPAPWAAGADELKPDAANKIFITLHRRNIFNASGFAFAIKNDASDEKTASGRD